MRIRLACLLALGCLSLSSIAQVQDSKRYRGARLDKAATDEAQRLAANDPGVEMSVYTSSDTFEKVCAFFKENGREFQMPGRRVRKLPTGQELRDAFFILDDAKDLRSSRLWVKVQRPFIGSGMVRSGAQPNEARDISAIIYSVRK